VATTTPPRWSTTGAILWVLSLVAFTVLAIEAHQHPYFTWDVRVATSLQRLPGLKMPMRLVSALGYGWRAISLIALIALLLWAIRAKMEAAFLALSSGLGALLDELAKALVGRPRPAAALVHITRRLGDASFPSGHVVFYCSSFGFLFALAFFDRKCAPAARRAVMTLAALPIVLVGPSRVYLGAHWPSDVLGGYLLGAAWLAIVLQVYRRWKTRSPKAADQRGIAPR
jgi:membrane-associated phospholipid phosphatase